MLSRRLFLTSGVAALAQTSSSGSNASLTELASEYASPLGGDLGGEVSSYGDGRIGAVLSYETSSWESLQPAIESRSDVELVTHLDAMNAAVVTGSPAALGLTFTRRLVGSGIQSHDAVERVDLVLDLEHPEPITSPIGSEEYDHPRGRVLEHEYSLGGIAFDADPSTIGDVRSILNVDEVDVTYDSDDEPVKVAVVDTGANVSRGRVFGRGTVTSPIRVPGAKNFVEIDQPAAEVRRDRVAVLHDSEADFTSAATLDALSVSGAGDSATVAFDPSAARSVATQSEWQAGTLTDAIATSSDDVEIDTYDAYDATGTYVSHWYDFGASTSFSNESWTLSENGETVTREYRSSPDGTDGNASAWYSDLTNVPDDQWLQVRVTLETTDDTTTPTVDSFTIESEFTVDSQTDWEQGTLSSTTATSDGVLELATHVEHFSTAEYASQWFDFGYETEFLGATVDETLNGETTTWEYRSSPDGTAGTASAWSTDITSVPADQYLQVRATLESSDGSATPALHQYSVDAQHTGAEYVGATHELTDVDRAEADLDLTSVTATVTLEALDDDTATWTAIADATTTDSGTTALDVDPDLEHTDWRVAVTFQTDASGASASLSLEGVESPEQIDNVDSDWSPVADGDDHGTFCLAEIAADPRDDTLRGIAADANVDLYAAKALADDGSGSTASILDAIEWCREQGVDLINLSLGSQRYNEAIDDAIQGFLEDGGTAVVAAAGNDRQGSRWVNSPADSDHAIAVAATPHDPPGQAKVGYFSNVGPDDGVTDLSGGETAGAAPDVAAPGINIECELPTTGGLTKRRTMTGTSMAAPVVTGLLALLLNEEPGLRGETEQVRERLQASAHPIPEAGETEVGAGMPLADRLLQSDPTPLDQSEEKLAAGTARDRANRAVSGSWLARRWN